MWSPTRILAATDFSRAGDAAVHVAAALARRTGATIELVHLIDELGAIADPAGAKARAQDRLEGLAKAAGTRGAVLKVAYAAPAETLCEEHAAGASDLMVLGARGLRGLRRFVLGSVADRALRRPGRPLLLVNRQPPGGEFKRILAAVELPDRSTPALRTALSLAHSLRSEVVVLHVLPPRGYVSDARHVELDPDSVPVRLEHLVAREDATVPVEISVQSGDPAAVIPSLARTLRVDLVVLGAERRQDGWPGRVADTVARAGLAALLYVWPEQETRAAAGPLVGRDRDG